MVWQGQEVQTWGGWGMQVVTWVSDGAHLLQQSETYLVKHKKYSNTIYKNTNTKYKYKYNYWSTSSSPMKKLALPSQSVSNHSVCPIHCFCSKCQTLGLHFIHLFEKQATSMNFMLLCTTRTSKRSIQSWDNDETGWWTHRELSWWPPKQNGAG